MNDSGNYTVAFGKTAGTLIYSDKAGELQFCFDIKPSKNPTMGEWTVELSKRPLLSPGLTETVISRDSQALERTKKYLQSRGYQVEIS